MLLQVVEIVTGVFLFLFLMRELLWWWFGIRRAIEALESIAESLEQMPAAKEHRARMNQSIRRVG